MSKGMSINWHIIELNVATVKTLHQHTRSSDETNQLQLTL
jgi:hypothetical protein